MKTASVRDLRTDFPRLEALLDAGESITITKHKRIVARLIPAGKALHPDFQARFGGRIPPSGSVKQSAVALLLEERRE